MKPVLSFAIALACVGPLSAQSHNFGLSFHFGMPSGDFREKVYAATLDVDVRQVEGYDIGFGGQLTMSIPLQKSLAFRLGVGGMSTRGTNTASGYDTIYLRHNLFSLSAEAQVFFDDAYRHSGTYLAFGLSGNFERFERSYDDNWDYWDYPYSERDITRKSRMGGTIGIGNTFYGRYGLNFTTELSYHATLTNRDMNRMEPHATDFLKFSFGFVF